MIIVNSKTYGGNNLIVSNGKIIIDSKDVTPDEKSIIITVNGDIKEISVDNCQSVTVNGNAGQVKTVSGDINITNSVNGDVKNTSGDIKCGDIIGNVSTISGDIKRK